MDFLAVSERFVAATFPEATIAVLAGSTARGERTSTSDIDLLLLGDALFTEGRNSLAGTYRFEDEVFAYTPEGFRMWADRGVEQHRPVIVQMLVEGTAFRGAAERDEFRKPWAARLSEGPSLDAHESALRRYVITDVLDDLRDARDPLEQRVIASLLFERTAELILLTNARWIGSGKYLPRRLTEFSKDRARRLSTPLLVDDYAAFADQVAVELDLAGGRVQEGFEREPGPLRSAAPGADDRAVGTHELRNYEVDRKGHHDDSQDECAKHRMPICGERLDREEPQSNEREDRDPGDNRADVDGGWPGHRSRGAIGGRLMRH